MFILRSSAFRDGERIPTRHTCEGDDTSPPLVWSGAPQGARSFALLCEDPDAPRGTWRHWAVYDIPADRGGLDGAFPKEAVVQGARQAVNDFQRLGYGGPCPPPGHGVHHYCFVLIALDVERLDVADGARYELVEEAAQRHAIAEARLVGTYAR